MTDFLITAPNGKKYKVTGDSKEGAVAALKKMLGGQTAAPPVPQSPVTQQTAPQPTAQADFNAYPAPSAAIADELYNQGPVGQRQIPKFTGPTAYSERTGGQLPETVQDANGDTYYLDPKTGSYSSRQMMTEQQQQRFSNGTDGMGTAFVAGSSNGVTMGMGDEIAGALLGDRARERARAVTDASRTAYPKTTTTGEIAGALSVPIPGKQAATLGEAVKYGAKAGAALSGVYAAADAEGGVINRIKSGLEGAVAGAVIGLATPLVVNFGSKAFRKLTATRPSLQSLRAAKTAAYNAVDSAGERFQPAELQGMVANARTNLTGLNYIPEADRMTAGVLNVLDDISQRSVTLGQLDKMRQDVWKRFNSSKEQGLLDVIDAIDELVVSRTATSELLDAARLANARYKKAELLDLAFKKATDQTASTGSGGNILNKYRQVVTSIINTPKTAKWFSPGEIEIMRNFVQGTPSRNFMRQIGKLAPTGNGLMTALNLGAAGTFGAPALAVSALASGAKTVADRATRREAQGLIGAVAGRAAPSTAPINYPGRLNALGGLVPN